MPPPITPQEWTTLVAVILLMVTLLWALPSCGDPRCVASHTAHLVGTRAEAIAKEHNTFHGTDRPRPECSLCQARKRDE